MIGLPRRGIIVFLLLSALWCRCLAAPKVHVISFGKWTAVQWNPGTSDDKPLTLKVRALLIDGRVKEYTLGPAHEVTDRLFVVRRAFRLNDSLPEEPVTAPRWQWERGGWLLVDRSSGHVSTLSLPEFDAFYSVVSWYRDYAAYCGVSDDGKKLFQIVAQVGRRKPVVKMPAGALPEESSPDSACPAPAWERNPVKATFTSGSSRQTYAIHGHVLDSVSNDDGEEEASK